MRLGKTIIGVGTATILLGAGVIADSRIDPYTDKGASLEIAEISTLPDAGEVKTILAKNEPKVTLEKWNGEVALGVRYVGLPQNTSGSRALLTNRMEWKGAKEEMHAYPLEKGEGGEDGFFEIEIVLNEKPAKNTFDFAIEGAGSLDFFYQPELTPEEIDEGASRPENVIGSYAVYHKTKANHRVGSTNYATGKAFHIFRPKAIDALGAEQWAELSYVNGVLSVTVPQKFLDEAVYPVRVDPTFGHTTIGGSKISAAGTIRKGRFSISEDGNGVSITTFLNVTVSNKNFKGNIYTDETGATDVQTALLSNGATEEKLITTGASQEITFNFNSSPSFSNGVFYRLSIWSDLGGGTGLGEVYYDSFSGENIYTDSQIYGTWPDPSADTHNANFRLAIYATYTASGGAAPAPKPPNPPAIFFDGDSLNYPAKPERFTYQLKKINGRRSY